MVHRAEESASQDERPGSGRDQTLLHAFLESSPDAALAVDRCGKILFGNAEAEKLFGYAEGQLTGQAIELLVPERLRATHGQEVAEFFQAPRPIAIGQRRNLHARHKDGRQIPVEIGLSPILLSDGLVVVATIRDMTARVRAEEKMLLIIRAAPAPMMMVCADGQIVLVNEAVERLFGYGSAELVGQSIELLIPKRFRRRRRQRVASFLARFQSRRLGQLFGLRKDGVEVPVEVALNPVRFGDELYVLCALTDMTERRRAQQQLLDHASQLERSNRELERSNLELQQLAHAASHDLQEPLRSIASFCQLLERRLADQLDEDSRQWIGIVVSSVARMKTLIDDLLSFSRVEGICRPFEPIRVAAVLTDVLTNLHSAIEESSAEVTWQQMPTVMGHRAQLVQLFQNLIGNAIKFHNQKPPRIHIAAQQEGSDWVFSVRDNGIGIEPQYYNKIFEVFQRLHVGSRYPGNGMGLAICRRVVHQHRGRIGVESEPGQGSTFHFTLPGVTSEAAR